MSWARMWKRAAVEIRHQARRTNRALFKQAALNDLEYSRLLVEAKVQAADEALEKAAQAIDRCVCSGNREHIKAAIRALKSKETPK